MLLPLTFEAAVREIERRGAEAAAKLDEATRVLLQDLIAADLDDPAVIRSVDRLRAVRPPARRLASGTLVLRHAARITR